MTEIEIKSLYKQIEGFNISEIQKIVDQEFVKIDSVKYNSYPAKYNSYPALPDNSSMTLPGKFKFMRRIKALFVRRSNKRDKREKRDVSELQKACQKSWNLNIAQIMTIINNNPKTSRCIMDIVILLAPAIAQQYSGMSGMAIVGTLTIICKQNLGFLFKIYPDE